MVLTLGGVSFPLECDLFISMSAQPPHLSDIHTVGL